ncbi:MAG: CoB--CoM heterodisulfide reductase iron-sulfur subunit A family protein [Archaeoglobi archaeon]|nr:CoB--CoM heterodisulfide reductase iron-sulfur subunit A family protein [Archaeoglobi archaeon]
MGKGVFICHCGNNIAENVDINYLKEKIAELDDVDFVLDHLFLCSQDAKELIMEMENKADMLVLASCSPENHEAYFSGFISKPFIIVNLREQCSWVHDDVERATKKAESLILAGIEKVEGIRPPKTVDYEVERSVAVIGGGIAGITAALELAKAGYRVHIVEKTPSIGGKLLKFDKIFPLNDCASCIISSLISEVSSNEMIDVHVYSEVEGVSGGPGRYRLKVRRKQTYVDWEKCIGCGKCTEACPERARRPDEFNEGLTMRSAMYIVSPFAYPKKAVHDPEICVNCGKKKIGTRRLLRNGKEYLTPCEKACPTGAIDRSRKWNPEGEVFELEVGAILLATGYRVMDKHSFPEFQPKAANVITALQMERILSPTGPSGGRVVVPSSWEKPSTIAFISCVGSRDERYYTHCSKVCCMYMLKQARLIKERNPEIDVYIHYIDIRAPGKDLEEYYTISREHGIKIVRGRVGAIESLRDGRLRIIGFDSDTGDPVEYEADLVVLATAIEIDDGVRKMARRMGLDIDSSGFIKEDHPKLRTVETEHDGIYLAGCVQGPKDVTETVLQAKSAAMAIANFLGKGRIQMELEVEVRRERCTLCGVCVTSCPYEAITIEGGEVRISPLSCRNCGICYASCPAGAIEMAIHGRALAREVGGLVS